MRGEDGCERYQRYTESDEMSAQLLKRARQLAQSMQRSEDEALVHLIGLKKQGWAAKETLASSHD